MPKGIDFLKTYSGESTKQAYRCVIAAFLSSVYKTKIAHDELEESAERYFREDRQYKDDVENYLTSSGGRQGALRQEQSSQGSCLPLYPQEQT
ncbi:MAG: hypothetical protein PHQ86_08010 [Dehalococcoidales bacterium]|nr:hypothetical protein [Dehalococcoidales bacterium]